MQTSIDLETLRRQHLDWLRAKNFSPHTIADRTHWLKHFIAWLTTNGIQSPADINLATLERYQLFWANHRKADGSHLSPHTQRVRLIPAKVFCRWLARAKIIDHDPTFGLESPRSVQVLPKSILTHAEAEQVMKLPVVGRRNGLRDRAILEVFYSTGIRRGELAELKLDAIEAERGLVMVRRGKCGKDRLIPIGSRALHWVRRYLDELRPKHVRPGTAPDTLFLTERGAGISRRYLTSITGRLVRRAKLGGKVGACHLFRHTMATLMLENGADIRYVQEQLGHASLQTTQIYTHVSVGHLKTVHTRTHPAESAFCREISKNEDEAIQPISRSAT